MYPTPEKRILAEELSEQLRHIYRTVEKELPELVKGGFELEGAIGALDSFSWRPDSDLHIGAFGLHEALKSGDPAKIESAARWLDRVFIEAFRQDFELEPEQTEGDPPKKR